MLVICNSDRRIDTQRLERGRLFVFGRIKALQDATFIIVMDQHGNSIAVHQNEIEWQNVSAHSTFPVHVSHYRILPPFLVDAKCHPFDRSRFGTIALRDDQMEQYLKSIPVIASLKEANNV